MKKEREREIGGGKGVDMGKAKVFTNLLWFVYHGKQIEFMWYAVVV